MVGDALNVMLCATAMNFKRVMNLFKKKMVFLWQNFQELLAFRIYFFYSSKFKMTFWGPTNYEQRADYWKFA